MLIKTENLKSLSRLFERIRTPKVAYLGSVYLDFENNSIYFQNETTFVKGRLESSGEEDIENVFVFDGDKFFALVMSYDELLFDGNTFTSPDNNTFKLNLFKEPFFPPEFEPTEEWRSVDFNLSFDTLQHIKNAIAYIPPDIDSLKGVFVRDGQLIALQPVKFYQAAVDLNVDMNLPLSFIKLLLSFPSLNNSILYMQEHGDAHRYLLTNGDLVMRFVTSENLELPVDIHSEDFISSYNHDNVLTVSKHVFQEALHFLDPFTKDIVNSKITLKFKPEESSLLIYVDDESNVIQYSVEVESFSSHEDFKDKEATLSLSSLSTILSHLQSEKVTISFEDDAPTLLYRCEDTDEYFIVQTKIESE